MRRTSNPKGIRKCKQESIKFHWERAPKTFGRCYTEKFETKIIRSMCVPRLFVLKIKGGFLYRLALKQLNQGRIPEFSILCLQIFSIDSWNQPSTNSSSRIRMIVGLVEHETENWIPISYKKEYMSLSLFLHHRWLSSVESGERMRIFLEYFFL